MYGINDLMLVVWIEKNHKEIFDEIMGLIYDYEGDLSAIQVLEKHYPEIATTYTGE